MFRGPDVVAVAYCVFHGQFDGGFTVFCQFAAFCMVGDARVCCDGSDGGADFADGTDALLAEETQVVVGTEAMVCLIVIDIVTCIEIQRRAG